MVLKFCQMLIFILWCLQSLVASLQLPELEDKQNLVFFSLFCKIYGKKHGDLFCLVQLALSPSSRTTVWVDFDKSVHLSLPKASSDWAKLVRKTDTTAVCLAIYTIQTSSWHVTMENSLSIVPM